MWYLFIVKNISTIMSVVQIGFKLYSLITSKIKSEKKAKPISTEVIRGIYTTSDDLTEEIYKFVPEKYREKATFEETKKAKDDILELVYKGMQTAESIHKLFI